MNVLSVAVYGWMLKNLKEFVSYFLIMEITKTHKKIYGRSNV